MPGGWGQKCGIRSVIDSELVGCYVMCLVWLVKVFP